MSALRTPRLQQLAARAAAEAASEEELEHCDLCAAPVPADHRHLLDLESRQLLCACQACRLLFERQAARGDHFQLIPDRRIALDDFVLDDASWAGLRIPVDIAFFFHATPAGRVVAFYPSPMGATESQLELDTWDQLVADNPVLAGMEPDVEALLVHRARGARQHFLVPVDDPYRLVALIRTHWRGLTGGREVWEEIDAFFSDLRRRSTCR